MVNDMRWLLELMCLGMMTIPAHEVVVAGEGKQTMYEEVYDQLMRVTADPSKGAHVSNLVMKRDVAVFTFEQGEIFLCTTVANRTCAALFVGKGIFSFTPPLRV